MENSTLTERQIQFLRLFGQVQSLPEQFYLSGGTALAGFYLHHRYSEDLDFFSESEINVEALNIFFKKIQAQLGFTKIDFQQSYNRNLFFLHFNDEVLKLEFTYYPFTPIEKGILEYGVRIDSLRDIAVNKLFTIYQQTRARDYIDLYCICQEKHWEAVELTAQAKAKFDWHIDPLQLGTQFMKAEEAKDYPRLIRKLDSREWQTFFREEAKKLKSEVFQ